MAAAGDIDAFYRLQIPLPCITSTTLVMSVDGKGIVMRPDALRPATQKAAAARGTGRFRTRLASGEKPARKRMATLAVVYDAAPAVRRPHDVIAPPGGRHGNRPLRPGPRAKNKWLSGSVADDPATVIRRAFDQAEYRDAGHCRSWVVLVDGAVHQRRTSFGRKWRRARTVVGLPDGFRFYDLRHTGHTLATRSGATLKDTMVRAGQSSEKAALIYQHSDEERQRDLAAGLDDMVRAERAKNHIDNRAHHKEEPAGS